mmetsp:Transcript_81479/g.161764  ORF Transcript_81479/g.161764 Transcript_81479/m.161764 type:complete len:332 (-) Transcript_81479:262-1257(-)
MVSSRNLLSSIFAEPVDYSLDGFPLVVHNTFIDICPGIGGKRPERRSSSVPSSDDACRGLTRLQDLRGHIFSQDGSSVSPGASESQLAADVTPQSLQGNDTTGGDGATLADFCLPRAVERRRTGTPSTPRSPDPHRQDSLSGRSPCMTSSASSPRSQMASEPDACGGSCQEPRTTVVLKNLPEEYTRSMLLDLLEGQGLSGCYNFVYLPINFGSHTNFGYALVNLVTPDDAERFMALFRGFTGWAINSLKVADVIWSGKRQGLENQIARYRNSPMLSADMPEEAKPLLLKDGVPVDFPPPTRRVKPLRVRASKTQRAKDLGLGSIFTERAG